MLVLRHGMAGHQGVEISGAFDEETEVRDADPSGMLPPDKLAPLAKARAREHSARLNAAKARKKGRGTK